jgi:parvulin-like peptidyl-prolyl isomerase
MTTAWRSSALAAFLALWAVTAGGAGGQAPAASRAVAAVVNGEPIPLAEVDAALQLTPEQAGRASGQLRQMRAEALNLLIDDVLFRQHLSASAPRVTAEECDRELAALKAGLNAQRMTLPDFLRQTNQTEEHLHQEIVKKLQWDWYLRTHATEAELRRYYEENRDVYDQVTVQASHILLRVPASAGAAERDGARARLEELRGRILRGELKFADAARKYSQCPSAAQGGDLGLFGRNGPVDEALTRAAFALPVGQVSDVVPTEYGLHLVRVAARRPGRPSAYEAVTEEVRRDFAAELWREIVAKQRRLAKIQNKLSG